MLHHKYAYFLAGLLTGYILGSMFLPVLTVLSVLFYVFWKKTPQYTKSYFLPTLTQFLKFINQHRPIENNPSFKKLNIRIRADVLREMEAYCRWKQESPGDFVMKSAVVIFVKDKEWVAEERERKKLSRKRLSV